MQEPIQIGYYIQKTWKHCPIGKTLCTYSQTIYSSEAEAQKALDRLFKDSRFTYKVVSVSLQDKGRISF